jgi:hypothetical protein
MERMMTVEHGLVKVVLWLGLLLISAQACRLLSRQRNRWVQFVSGMGFAACCLLLIVCGLELFGFMSKDVTAKSYSPDRTQVVVLRHWGSAGKREGTYATLYGRHGWREEEIARGNFRAFQPGGVHWLSEDELELKYDPKADSKPSCDATPRVTVRCVPMP